MFIWSAKILFHSIYIFTEKHFFGNLILGNPYFGLLSIADERFFMLTSPLTCTSLKTNLSLIHNSQHDTYSLPNRFNTQEMYNSNISQPDVSQSLISCGDPRRPEIFITKDDDSWEHFSTRLTPRLKLKYVASHFLFNKNRIKIHAKTPTPKAVTAKTNCTCGVGICHRNNTTKKNLDQPIGSFSFVFTHPKIQILTILRGFYTR